MDLNAVIFIIALFSSVKKLISLNQAHINFSSAAGIKIPSLIIFFSKEFFDKWKSCKNVTYINLRSVRYSQRYLE